MEERRRKDSPDAQVLVWVAWQGSACAASQRLPGDVFTRVHRRVLMQIKHQRLHRKHRGGSSAKHQIGGEWWRRIPKGNTIQISSEGKIPRFPTGGVGRGGGGDLFALGGGGDSRRSRPERPGDGGDPVARGSTGAREESEKGLGWVGLTDPDPNRGV
jgi:hypothetical protein